MAGGRVPSGGNMRLLKVPTVRGMRAPAPIPHHCIALHALLTLHSGWSALCRVLAVHRRKAERELEAVAADNERLFRQVCCRLFLRSGSTKPGLFSAGMTCPVFISWHGRLFCSPLCALRGCAWFSLGLCLSS